MMTGMTLVEVILALTILAIGMSIAGLAFNAARPATQTTLAQLNAARSRAIAAGVPVIWRDGRTTIRFLPDGSSGGGAVVVGGNRIRVDMLTGEDHAEK